MSYNADRIKIVANQGLSVRRAKLKALLGQLRTEGVDFPERCTLTEEAPTIEAEPEDELLRVENLRWCGDGSGHTWDVFTDRVLPVFDGNADLVVCFEGGDYFEGLRLHDHKITKHRVVMSLGEEIANVG